MADNLWLDLLTQGTAANRPTSKPVHNNFALYYETDTGVTSAYINGAWVVFTISAGMPGMGAVTASPTQTLAAATQLLGEYANLSVVATANDSVKLPLSPRVGQYITVSNAGVAAAKVWPGEAASTIDGGSAGAGVTLTNAKSALFTCIAAGAWQSIGFATRSA